MTDDITTCQVINKHDDLLITICTEWLDSGFKITIFSDQPAPLIGQMKLKEVATFSKNLCKTQTEYIEVTRSVLSGKDFSVQFILKDGKFRWKKGAWNYGIIDMDTAKPEEVFPELLKKFLRQNEQTQITMDRIKSENEELRSAQSILNNKLEEIIILKNAMEEDLYRRFIVVLNFKKEKIRELETELSKKAGIENKVNKLYEMDTEESGMSEEENDWEENKAQTGKIDVESFLKRNSGSKRKFRNDKLLKRQISDSEGQMIDSDYEEDRKMKTNGKHAGEAKSINETTQIENRKSITPTPSTSKNKTENNQAKDKIEEKFSTAGTSARSALNFESEESEEDMFA